MESDTRGSRRVFRPFSEPSLVHTRRRSPSRPTQTGAFCGEPSGIRVARCAKFARSIRAWASVERMDMRFLLPVSGILVEGGPARARPGDRIVDTRSIPQLEGTG